MRRFFFFILVIFFISFPPQTSKPCIDLSSYSKIRKIGFWPKHQIFFALHETYRSDFGNDYETAKKSTPYYDLEFFYRSLKPIAKIAHSFRDYSHEKGMFLNYQIQDQNQLALSLRQDLKKIYDLINERKTVTGQHIEEVLTKHAQPRFLPKVKNCEVEVKSLDKGLMFYYFDSKTNKRFLVDSRIKGQGDYGYEYGSCYKMDGGQRFLSVKQSGFGNYGSYEHEFFISFSPKDVSYLQDNVLGYRAYKKKEYKNAKKLFHSSVEKNPDYHHANFNLACVMSLLHEPFEMGIPHLERLLNRDDLYSIYMEKIATDSDLNYWRKRSRFQAWFDDQKRQALDSERLEVVLNDAQRSGREANRKGLKAYLKRDYDLAEKEFKKAIKLDKKFVLARINLASIYVLTHRDYLAYDEVMAAKKLNSKFTTQQINNDPDLKRLRPVLKGIK